MRKCVPILHYHFKMASKTQSILCFLEVQHSLLMFSDVGPMITDPFLISLTSVVLSKTFAQHHCCPSGEHNFSSIAFP